MSATLASRPAARTHDATPADPVRAWLAHLFSPAPDLPAFAAVCVPPSPDRSPAETAAAARAAACPDLFVVHAPDLTAGERVIADTVRAFALASATGRVLILTPNAVAADRLVERLARAGDVSVLRALADDENPARPSPVVAKLTSVASGAGRAEQAKRDAVTAITAADARLTALEKLTELHEKLAKLNATAAQVAVTSKALEAVVRAETDTSFAAKLVALKVTQAEANAALLVEWQAFSLARKEKEASLVAIRSHQAELNTESAKKPGFFTRILGLGKATTDPVDLEKQAHWLEAELATLAVRIAEFQAKTDELATRATADSENAILAETAHRRAEFDAKLAGLEADLARLQGEIDVTGAATGVSPPAPAELPAVQYAATRALVEARERADEVNRTTSDLARRFLAEPRVVVGIPQSLKADPVFSAVGEQAASGAPPFELLILDRAEELGEPHFVDLAKLAARWLLVGDAAPHSHLNGSRNGPGRNGRQMEPAFAARLARILDRETWASEDGRLICRLLHPTTEQRRKLTREPLLDRPEIELRFTQDAAGEPALAEVAFPGTTSVAAAKSFLFHEVGEVLLRPCGAADWHHDANVITVCWPTGECSPTPIPTEWIDLEPGVREKTAGTGIAAFTATITFDPAAGWDADKARSWLETHLPADGVGRYAAVPRTAPTGVPVRT